MQSSREPVILMQTGLCKSKQMVAGSVLDYFDRIVDFIRPTKTIHVSGCPVSLHTAHRHEKHYWERYVNAIPHPQIDIDIQVFNAFLPKGSRALDAGANIGLTALQMIDAGAGFVVACEPVPELACRLKSLQHRRLEALDVAISDKVGRVDLMVSTAHNQGSSYKSAVIDAFSAIFEGSQKISVPTTTIDELTAQYGTFDFWKLDIEGAEIDALNGAQLTLERSPPSAIFAEIYSRDDVLAFSDILKATHPTIRRAYIGRDRYDLMLVDRDQEPDPTVHHHTSPMYLATA